MPDPFTEDDLKKALVRRLKQFILEIGRDLVGDFQPEFLGKLNFYLEALDREVKKPHENPTIGVLLCTENDKEVVKFALSRNISPTLIAEYETKLIDKNLLRRMLHEWTGEIASEE